MSPQAGFLLQVLGYLLLGAVQGLAGVLPVSGSAHLALTRALLEKTVGLYRFSFEAAIVLHLGACVSIVNIYRRDLEQLWRVWPSTQWLWVIASLALTGTLGVFLRPWAQAVFDQPLMVAGLLVANGGLLAVAARRPAGHRRLTDLHGPELLLLGLAQGLAVVPGISRFGIVLCAGLARGLSWYEAVKLAFLLSLPTVVGAIGWTLLQAAEAGTLDSLNTGGLLLGTLVAGTLSWLALHLLLRQARPPRSWLLGFATYCVVTGLFAGLFFLLLG